MTYGKSVRPMLSTICKRLQLITTTVPYLQSVLFTVRWLICARNRQNHG